MAKNETYEQFVEKFKYKHTTDDCYTPENIYEAVASYVEGHYGKDRGAFVRPFWPGGDFESFDYPAGCIVVDNPPFSIMSKIVKFYNNKKIDYFLFCSGLTPPASDDSCIVCLGVEILYENGASISTSFVTNLDKLRARSAPDLYKTLKDENKKNIKTKKVKGYSFPKELATASMINRLSVYGIQFEINKDESKRVRTVGGAQIYGSGWLVSKSKAKELDEAKRLADEAKTALESKREEKEKEKIILTEEEKNIIKSLGR